MPILGTLDKYIAIYEYLNVPPAQIDTKDIHLLLL